jgi:histidinol dehydrogenase
VTLPVWKTDDADFRPKFKALVSRLRLEQGLRAPGSAEQEPPEEAVRRIIDDVRKRGDAALLEYTERFDRCRLTARDLRISADQVEAAVARCPGALLDALRLSAERIRKFQQSILLHDPEPLRGSGRTLDLRYRPVDSACVYIPGGTASLASTVLMAAVPAKVAGVKRVAMTTPPRPDASVSDDRLAAAAIAGVDEVYRIGSAWAIAAFAYGTESVRAVDFVAGPGNIYVTLAKKQVFGQVGIEMLAGPSEVVIIADGSAEAVYVAADLLAQAEHDPGSALLLTDDEPLAVRVAKTVEAQLAALPRADAARECLSRYGAAIVCGSMDECVELANELAPEHLEVLAQEPEAIADRVRHAAAIFLGPWSPVAVGDYVAGPSHILPTSGTARFSSGLWANDFLKRSSVIRYDRQALSADAPAITRMARAEGLDGHARSVEVRNKETRNVTQ